MALDKGLIPDRVLKDTGERTDTRHGTGVRADTIHGTEVHWRKG